MKGIQTRQGAILLWRLGPLKFQDQKNYRRRNVPTARGMWTFPWPYYDVFFTYHQYSYMLPKRLKTMPRSGWPIATEWYRLTDEDGIETPLDPSMTLEWPEADEYGRIGKPCAVTADGEKLEVDSTEGFYEQQEEWIRTVGMKILPLRKFWYEGEVFAHFDKKGNSGSSGTIGGDTDWYPMHTTELAKALLRNRGTTGFERPRKPGDGLSRFKYSVDHLEIFVPAGRGKIYSPRDLRKNGS